MNGPFSLVGKVLATVRDQEAVAAIVVPRGGGWNKALVVAVSSRAF